MNPGMKALRIIGAAAAVYLLVCFLNLLLGAYIWFPRFEWRWIFIPLPESAAAALILIGITGLKHRPTRPRQTIRSAHISESRVRISFSAHFFLLIFTVLFLLLLVFSATEAFFQHVYLRTFDIRANIPLLSHFFNRTFFPPAFPHFSRSTHIQFVRGSLVGPFSLFSTRYGPPAAHTESDYRCSSLSIRCNSCPGRTGSRAAY